MYEDSKKYRGPNRTTGQKSDDVLGLRGAGNRKERIKVKNKTCHESLDLARRIRAAGIRIPIKEDDRKATDIPSDGVLIRLVGGEAENMALDFHGGTAFIIWACITINLSRFAISAFGLELPWKCAVRWLENPLKIDGTSEAYRFDGRYLPDFERTQVLNHRADVCRTLSRGSSVEGCLLGVADECIPDAFPHGMIIPGFLIVFDQFSREYRSPISLCADRSQKLLPDIRHQVARKRLFDCPDPGYCHASLEDNDTSSSVGSVK
jgi:hypothetical protein